MLNSDEYNILIHDLKNAVEVLRIVRDEDDHEKRLAMTKVLVKALDHVIEDMDKMQEK